TWESDEMYGAFTVVLPPDATSFQLPTLPSEYASYLPSGDAQVYPFLFAYESSAIETYRAALRFPVTGSEAEGVGSAAGQHVRASFAGSSGRRIIDPRGPSRPSMAVRPAVPNRPAKR